MNRRSSGAHRAQSRQPTALPSISATLQIPTAAAMRRLGERLGSVLRAGDLVVLSGDLGAGKTTLTQGLARRMRVEGQVSSPTLVLARVHPSLAAGPSLVHVDAYRLQALSEVDDLDLDARLADSVTVVEWGEGLVGGLGADRLQVRLRRAPGTAGPDDAELDGDQPRVARVRGFGPRWADVALPLT